MAQMKHCKNFLEKESFMDAEETALSYGLVDEIIDAENSSGTEAKKRTKR